MLTNGQKSIYIYTFMKSQKASEKSRQGENITKYHISWKIHLRKPFIIFIYINHLRRGSKTKIQEEKYNNCRKLLTIHRDYYIPCMTPCILK